MPDRRSALAHLAPIQERPAANAPDRAVVLEEVLGRGLLVLRGDPGDRAFLSAVGGVLDLVLPTEPNTVTGERGVTALWAGPEEWHLAMPVDEVPAAAAQLETALAGIAAAVVDLSHARTVLRLGGARAPWVMAKGCPLDLHPRAFHVGQAARSVIAGTPVLVHRCAGGEEEGTPSYDLYVPRSFADHLWRWLCDAAAEYGGAAGPVPQAGTPV